jgi:acetyl-CoA C-acetyltransferase
MSDSVVIVEAKRTAVGKIGGGISKIAPETLGTAVAKNVLESSGIDPAIIGEVVFGHCRQSSHNPNIARLISLLSGVPEDVASYTVMRQCASGMTAVNCAAQAILAGQYDVALAGGTESMSLAPFYVMDARFGVGTGNVTLFDSVTEVQFKSQPEDIYGRFNMIQTADKVADVYKIERDAQDDLAIRSQTLAVEAINSGRFEDETVPVSVPQRKADPIEFKVDEFPVAKVGEDGKLALKTSREKLSTLKPIFEGGTVTAGNASGRNDGASAMLLMSESKAKDLGLKPIARIVGMAAAGTDPTIMGIGPVPATRKVLAQTGLSLDDIGLIEINEAFAAQSVACIRELGLNTDILNVNGGAIALGHPVGSSGCRIMVTLVHEMRKRGVKYGLATLCIAGGMGMADIVELID